MADQWLIWQTRPFFHYRLRPMPTEDRTLYLVDGSSYLFRAFYALPELTNDAGEPTGALYGVANMLRRWMKDHSPRYMAFVFDASGKNFRHEIYPEYKANRPPMPDDLRGQIEPLLELIDALGIPILRVPGVEADDVIGTLASQAPQQGFKALISTGDKDMAQLVNEQVTLVNTMTDVVLDQNGVMEKFGVRPDQIIDYLALMGDSSDNIPGVPKVGPKTAAKWLAKYENLDTLVASAGEIGGKIGEHLRGALEQLPVSRDLATIRTTLDLDQVPLELELKPPNEQHLAELLTRYNFSTWLSEIGADAATGGTEPEQERHYEVVLDRESFSIWLERLLAADAFAFDIETTSIDPMCAELVGLSFACEANHAAYLPLAHTYTGAPEQLDREWVLEQLRPLLEDPQRTLIGQHFKYDYIVLKRYGLNLPPWRFDTMLESYVFNSTASRHNMDALARKYLGRETIHYETVAGKGAKQLRFDQVDLELAVDYAAEDADITLQLHQALWPKLQAKPGPEKIFSELEMPLAPLLARIEMTGVLVDAGQLKGLSQEFAKRMHEVEQEAFQVAGHSFNLGSPKQLQVILFEELELPIIRKTPKGQPSTAEDVLEQLARDYPLPQLIMEFRGLSKLKSTYTDKLPQQINPQTGRIHTSYHQAVAATGRLSSTDPNLQNIPIRNADGRRIRQAFIAPEGCKLLAADYSQVELRIMAHLSDDEGLLQAFRDGLDIHAATAAEVFGGTPESVSGETRRAAKAINFGLIYGMSAFGLARQLDVNRAEAQEYIDLYFSRYPGVQAYMQSTRDQAHEQGYVETVFGRRLYLNEINSRNYQRRQGAERAAINAPMQGTAADIIKRAMLSVDAWLQEQYQGRAAMTMQVHDELVLEVRSELTDEITVGIKQRMSAAAELKVPLVVDVGVGKNWDEAH
jgi:DNA polymerase-1